MSSHLFTDLTKCDDQADSSPKGAFLSGLVGAYRDIYASALSIVGNRNDAEDVMQEVCIILWQKYSEFEPGTSFRKWACSIAFHVARNYVRKHRRCSASALSDYALGRIAQAQAGSSELLELRKEVLRKCVNKLSHHERTLLEQCYATTQSMVDLARQEDSPVETIYTRLKRLRKKLTDCVQRTMRKID